jgi:hypothetical protein
VIFQLHVRYCGSEKAYEELLAVAILGGMLQIVHRVLAEVFVLVADVSFVL